MDIYIGKSCIIYSAPVNFCLQAVFSKEHNTGEIERERESSLSDGCIEVKDIGSQ